MKEGRKIITKVEIANKEGITAARRTGTVDLGNCELNNVLYIPDLRRNLLFGRKIAQYCILYVIQNNKTTEKAMTVDKKSSVKLWHERLSHLSINNIIKLLELSESIKLKKEEIEEQLSNCKMYM